jgi:long-chain acyl-CoA synthetase
MTDLTTMLAAPASGEPAAAANLAALVVPSGGPDPVALTFAGRSVTRAQVAERAARAVGLLRERGVGRGDRVALQIPNVPAFAYLYYAILRLGAIVVPMNPLLREREIAYSLQQSGARLLARHAAPDLATPPVEVDVVDVDDPWMDAILDRHDADATIAPVASDDTAVILYTSGTTGRPKGAELTHRSLRLNAVATREVQALAPGDAVLGVLPLYHCYGQTCVLNSALSIGARVVLLERFDADSAVELIARERIDLVLGVPTMLQAILEATTTGDALRSVRYCQSGGAPLPLATLAAAQERFGCPVVEGYGLTETSPVATLNAAEPRPAGSVGRPIAGVEIAIDTPDGGAAPAGTVGEILIRGHNIMKGYWNDPEATAAAIDADGWFRSGDLGRLDEGGFLHLVGRSKDLIIRGGMNVYPREVEEVLHEHPDVLEAAVVGVPDDRLGEEVGAALRLAPDAHGDLDEIRGFVRAHLAPYKYPRRMWVVDELPKGPTGKILKREIHAPPRA